MTTHVTRSTKKGRGRPKVFDREATLDRAMALFWQYGYEATSLADLVEATGAKAPTLYAEFTNKEGLFRAVLDRYISQFAAKHKAKLFCDDKSVAQAIEDYLTALAHCFASKDTPAGCFLINTSATVSASSEKIADVVRSRHAQQEAMLLEFFVQRQEKGELPAHVDLPALTAFINCLIQGMSVSAREGATTEDLLEIIATTLSLWPTLIAA